MLKWDVETYQMGVMKKQFENVVETYLQGVLTA